MRIVPEVGSIIRLIIRSEVVLPQPDGPTSTVIAPSGIVRERLPTATVPSGYLLVTSTNSITVVLLVGAAQVAEGKRALRGVAGAVSRTVLE